MLDVDFLGMDGGDCWGNFRVVAIPNEHTVTQVMENGQLTLQAHRV